MKVEEMPRASEGDTIELEGKVFRLKAPNSNDFEGEIVWSQFIILKDETGEQGCWLKLDSKEDNVTKGTSIKIKGKLGKEYTTSRGKKARSINNCDFEVSGKVQAPAQSSQKTSGNGNGTKDNYWEKKFIWDQKVHFSIIRECAIKAVTELAKIPPSKTFLIKVHTEKDFFEFSDKIVAYICRKLKATEESKEERIEKAREAVGETDFRPASTEQKKYIFGYRNNEDKWCKGIIESRYMTKPEIREIGDPNKLSLEDATEWLLWWWGPDKKTGERKKREKENPIDDIKESGGLVKGDKTSLVKDVLIDDINALRRENFLSDDVKFKEELGYNPELEELTEKELKTLKDLLKNFHPKDWDK